MWKYRAHCSAKWKRHPKAGFFQQGPIPVCKTSSVLECQKEGEQITKKVKKQVPLSCFARLTMVSQNHHRDRWQCEATIMYSPDLLFNDTTNHRYPGILAQPPDIRLLNHQCMQAELR